MSRRASSPATLALDTSERQLSRLSMSVLRLHLDHFHLSHGGSKTDVVRRLYNHLQGMLALGSDYSDDDGSGDDHDEPHSDEDPSESGEDDGDSPQQSLDDTLSSPSSTPDDSGSDPTPDDERHHLSAALTSKLKKHKSSRTREATKKRKHYHSHNKKSKRSRRYEDTSTDSSSSSDGSSTDTSSTDSHRHGKSHKRDRRSLKRSQLTVPISRSLARKIARCEFVDFSKLLTSHLVAKGNAHKGGKASANRIASLDTWLQAWSLFASVLSTRKPALAPELFSYQAFISRSSSKFQSYAWLQYDAQFRLKMASTRSSAWGTPDTELLASWLSSDATRRKATCFNCGNPDHLFLDCPLKASSYQGPRCPVCNSFRHSARDRPHLPSTQ